jgi:hypothetical protein
VVFCLPSKLSLSGLFILIDSVFTLWRFTQRLKLKLRVGALLHSGNARPGRPERQRATTSRCSTPTYIRTSCVCLRRHTRPRPNHFSFFYHFYIPISFISSLFRRDVTASADKSRFSVHRGSRTTSDPSSKHRLHSYDFNSVLDRVPTCPKAFQLFLSLPRTGCLGPLVTGPANRSDILLPTTHVCLSLLWFLSRSR